MHDTYMTHAWYIHDMHDSYMMHTYMTHTYMTHDSYMIDTCMIHTWYMIMIHTWCIHAWYIHAWYIHDTCIHDTYIFYVLLFVSKKCNFAKGKIVLFRPKIPKKFGPRPEKYSKQSFILRGWRRRKQAPLKVTPSKFKMMCQNFVATRNRKFCDNW